MQRPPRGVYTKEFRAQAVRLVLEEGLPIPQAGQRLSMSPKTLANWVGAARRGELAALGGRQKPLTEIERELARLRRELAEVTMERDILKNHSPGAPGLAWTETRVDTRLRRLSGQRPLAYW